MCLPHLISFFFSSRRRHTRCSRDWSSDVCSSDLLTFEQVETDVRARNAGLAGELEDAFASLRARTGAGAGPEELDAIHARLLAGLEGAGRVGAGGGSGADLRMPSFGMVRRGGVEG